MERHGYAVGEDRSGIDNAIVIQVSDTCDQGAPELHGYRLDADGRAGGERVLGEGTRLRIAVDRIRAVRDRDVVRLDVHGREAVALHLDDLDRRVVDPERRAEPDRV